MDKTPAMADGNALEPTKQIVAADIEAAPLDADSTCVLQGWRLYSVQTCVMDSSVVATALLSIGHYFDDFIKLQWVVLAYLLTYLGCATMFSRISDVIGRKRATTAAVVLLAIFSLGAGLSQSLNQVIAFRALQGVGGAGLYTLAFTTLPEITPRAKFGLMNACLGIVFAISAVLGPTIGGIITTHSTWRWVFYFNLPCCALILGLILISWPNTQSPGQITWRQLDYFGGLLFTSASVLLVLALQEAGTGTYEWGSTTIICCFVFAGLSTIALSLWVWYLSKSGRNTIPIFPSRIIAHRILFANMTVSALIGYVFYTALVELPQRFQIINGKSSQSAGLDILPISGASAVGSALGALLSSKKNRSFYTLFIGCSLVLLGSGLIYSISLDHGLPPKWYGFQSILGFGMGMVISSTIIFIKLYASLADAAPAQGLLAQTRILGGNIGLAVATIIQNQQLTTGLRGTLSATQIADLRRSLSVIETFTRAEVAAVADVFQQSFQIQVEVCMVLAGVSLLFCALTFDRHPPNLAQSMVKEKEQDDMELQN